MGQVSQIKKLKTISQLHQETSLTYDEELERLKEEKGYYDRETTKPFTWNHRAHNDMLSREAQDAAIEKRTDLQEDFFGENTFGKIGRKDLNDKRADWEIGKARGVPWELELKRGYPQQTCKGWGPDAPYGYKVYAEKVLLEAPALGKKKCFIEKGGWYRTAKIPIDKSETVNDIVKTDNIEWSALPPELRLPFDGDNYYKIGRKVKTELVEKFKWSKKVGKKLVNQDWDFGRSVLIVPDLDGKQAYFTQVHSTTDLRRDKEPTKNICDSPPPATPKPKTEEKPKGEIWYDGKNYVGEGGQELDPKIETPLKTVTKNMKCGSAADPIWARCPDNHCCVGWADLKNPKCEQKTTPAWEKCPDLRAFPIHPTWPGGGGWDFNDYDGRRKW